MTQSVRSRKPNLGRDPLFADPWYKLVTVSECYTMEPRHLLHSALIYWVGMYGILNWDAHFYPLHNNSYVHLTSRTEMHHSRQTTDGMRSGWRTLWDSIVYLSPTLLEWYLDNCQLNNCCPAKLPPRKNATPDNCHIGQSSPRQLPHPR